MDLTLIAALSLAQLPFTVKFLWAPAVDRFTLLPFMGRRRSWMLISQITLIVILFSYALLGNTSGHYDAIFTLTAILCFFSATQDIVIDAYRREILNDKELGLGNSIHVNAYRLSALIPGSLSLILADNMPWPWVFAITAFFMLPGVFFSLFLAKEPTINNKPPRSLYETVVLPFQEFFTRKGLNSALMVLLFIFLYKLGDSMTTALATPFYLDMGYSKTHIGIIAKNAGLWPAIIFGIVGGIMMLKIGINKALWLFGVVQMVTILGFVWLSSFGHFDTITGRELWILALVVGAEYTGVGLGTAAFVAYIARETNPVYTATQLALLSSLSAVPRTFINATTGKLVEWLGYYSFFWLCFFLAIPGMLLLFKVAPWHGEQKSSN
jgi:PAT family beta-lactamase induction signal transducer AmpG